MAKKNAEVYIRDPKGTGMLHRVHPLTKCSLCDTPTKEEDLCGDLACRACHKSITFDECVDGSWVATQRAAAGLPTRGE